MILELNLSFMRFLRWTILVPVLIYVSLLYVKLRDVPLKSYNINGDDETEIVGFERLFFELDAATVSGILHQDLIRLKYVRMNRNDEDAIKEIEQAENSEDSRYLLEEIFQRADNDKNAALDVQELARWIHAKITDHIGRATKENYGLFTAIDVDPSNGEVTWDEYHAHFLRLHGFSEKYINYHNKKHSELSRSLKENIMRDRARWTEAARNDPEKLTLDEFLSFTHPESSDRALLQMVEDLFDKFDRDGDEQLTEEEFSSLPAEGMGLEFRDDNIEPMGGKSEDRGKEFRHLIDKDKNGKADRSELLTYIDPRNPRYAIQEARHLIALSDVNNDGKLILPEILGKMDLFLGSKMVDTDKSFHDEFR